MLAAQLDAALDSRAPELDIAPLLASVGVMGLGESHAPIQQRSETASEQRSDPLQVIGTELVYNQQEHEPRSILRRIGRRGFQRNLLGRSRLAGEQRQAGA